MFEYSSSLRMLKTSPVIDVCTSYNALTSNVDSMKCLLNVNNLYKSGSNQNEKNPDKLSSNKKTYFKFL